MPENRGRTDAPRLLIFVVAYQAESTLKEVLDRLPREILTGFEVEVLVVDDASTDRTFEIGREYLTAHPELPLTVLRNIYNQGYGGNQKIGYAYASQQGFDFVALIHGDGQYAPEELGRLLEPIVEGRADAVFGSRMLQRGAALKGGMPLYKFVGNKVLTRLQNTMLGRNFSEYHSGYRIYRVTALDQIHYKLNTNDFHFDTQIILQLLNNGSLIVELPIPTYYGDEISRVNGLRYAFDVVVNTAASVTHRLGFWQQRRLDPVDAPSPYRPKLSFVSSHSLAVSTIRPGSRVLDLGGGGFEVAAALTEKGCKVTVVDAIPFVTSHPSITFMQQNLDDPLEFDATEFDTILMLDAIEHVSNPEDFLDRLRSQFDHRPVQLVMSTANIAFFTQRLSLLIGQFNYGRSGILDRKHKRLFTFRTLRHLLRDSGFRISSMQGVPVPFPLILGRRASGAMLWLNAFMIGLSRTLFSFQIFVVAESTPSVEFLVADAVSGGRCPR